MDHSLSFQDLNVATAADPRDYAATRPSTNRPYTPSPENWRKLSCYTVGLVADCAKL
jgi:hypothetical protein